ERYFNSGITSDVYVNLSVYNEEQRIEVTIPMTNLLLRAEEEHVDLYAAIDLVVDKLERQIRKHKTKINPESRQDGKVKKAFADLMPEQQTAELSNEIEIVRTTRFNFRPMHSEEPIPQLDLLGHTFFVFENAESGDSNVVYRR